MNRINIVILLSIILVVLGCGEANQNPPAAQSTTPNPAAELSPITWNQYDSIYNLKSSSTDMQKEQSWGSFKGKRVSWSGEVAEVSKGTFGGVTVSIKMNKDTLTSDVRLKLKKGYETAAASLVKGARVKYVGTLENYGGAVMPVSMGDGEIH